MLRLRRPVRPDRENAGSKAEETPGTTQDRDGTETLPEDVGVPKLPPEFDTRDPDQAPSHVTRSEGEESQPSPSIKETAKAWKRTTRRIAQLRSSDLREDRCIGRYELREMIGHGGCGTVYSAWDPRHEREVAIKLITRSDPRAKGRFQREIKAIARLRHPGIVPLLDSGEEKGVLYLVLELIRGPSLADFAKEELEQGNHSIERFVTLVRDACRAIQHAHEQGVLHRDLKPQNVLVDQHGQALVVDFGLARMEDQETLTRPGAPMGTPAYMSPEQAGGSEETPLDARTDVYSLGATLFQALTGTAPFGKKSGEELLLAVFRHDPPPPSRVHPAVPPELDAVVLKCMEKDPGQRYPGAAPLADELDRFLRGDPVEARPLGRLRRGWRWARRNPLAAGLAAAVVVVGLAFLALLAEYERLLRELSR
jgi:serine/threonine-protein kinase